MILRRMADGIRTQNWFTVVIEIFVVVIGIFLGLQVTDWNDSRKDRSLEREYLTRIDADMDQSAEIFERLRNLETTRVEAAKYLFSVMDDPAAVQTAPCNFAMTVLQVALASYPNPLRQTYDEMIASGGLSLVRNNEVKKALSTYYAGFDTGEDRLNDNQTLMRDYVRAMRSVTPLEMGHSLNEFTASLYGKPEVPIDLVLEACKPHTDQIIEMHRDYSAHPRIGGYLLSVEALHFGLVATYKRLLRVNRQTRALIAAELGDEGATPGDAPGEAQ